MMWMARPGPLWELPSGDGLKTVSLGVCWAGAVGPVPSPSDRLLGCPHNVRASPLLPRGSAGPWRAAPAGVLPSEPHAVEGGGWSSLLGHSCSGQGASACLDPTKQAA